MHGLTAATGAIALMRRDTPARRLPAMTEPVRTRAAGAGPDPAQFRTCSGRESKFGDKTLGLDYGNARGQCAAKLQ